MSDFSYDEAGVAGGSAAGGDAPVNPYSLLEAVNAASATARGGWVLFLGLMTYVLIAVAGISHTDLLLNSKVDLPILQVEIELTRFFLFAPLVLLFVHFGLLVQHVMLSRKTLEFDKALMPLEATRHRTHPLRLELHSYFFTQALAGPQRGWLLSGFLHAMVWLTLVVLPVTIMLFTQVVFLPYHDIFITWCHRGVLIADTLILVAMGVFLRRPEASFLGAFWRTAWHHPVNFLATGILLAGLLLFSFFVATVPDEMLDRLAGSLPGYQVTSQAGADGGGRTVFSLTAFFLEAETKAGTDGFRSVFHRNLIVTDEDLVEDRNDGSGEISINLRGRDLRYARLDRTDLHRADLTGADLSNASLVGTDLRRARLSCSDVNAVLTLAQSREESCTLIRDADFSRAKLNEANLQLAFLARTRFESAQLTLADLRYAELQGAEFSGADMRGSDMSGGTDLSGASFLGTLLHGADLSGANLQGADFSSAALQGALFSLAQAQGASFQGAEMDGVNLNFARLQGANLDGATLGGADLSSAVIWATAPPQASDAELADLDQLKIEQPRERDIESLKGTVNNIAGDTVRERVRSALEKLFKQGESKAWGSSEEARTWRDLGEASVSGDQSYSRKLTRFLTDISCQVRWSDGSVAVGVVERALMPGFGGDIATIYERLHSPACPASERIPEALMKRLSAEIERRGTPVEGDRDDTDANGGADGQ